MVNTEEKNRNSEKKSVKAKTKHMLTSEREALHGANGLLFQVYMFWPFTSFISAVAIFTIL